jgi:endo-1,4-beta-xylanase
VSNSHRYYNDYNLEQNGKKTDRAVEIVEILQKAGAPIDGVGFQGHLIVGETPSRSELVTVLERFTALDVEVAFTELDIRHPAVPASAAELKKQGDEYVNVVGACLDVKGCVGVTVWGITDKYSWIPDVFPGTGEALLYTDEYEKKPAWTSVSSLLAAAAATGSPISSTVAPVVTTAAPTTMLTKTKPAYTDDCDDIPETDEPVYPTTSLTNNSAPTTTMASRTALAPVYTDVDDNDDDCETEEAPFPTYVIPTNGTETLPTKAPVYDDDDDCEDDSAPIYEEDEDCEDDDSAATPIDDEGDFEPTAVAISTAAASAPTRAPVVRTTSVYTNQWNTQTRPSYQAPSGTAPAGPVGTGNAGLVKHYYQCGGKNYNGPTECEKPYKCVEHNPYYHQCVEA